MLEIVCRWCDDHNVPRTTAFEEMVKLLSRAQLYADPYNAFHDIVVDALKETGTQAKVVLRKLVAEVGKRWKRQQQEERGRGRGRRGGSDGGGGGSGGRLLANGLYAELGLGLGSVKLVESKVTKREAVEALTRVVNSPRHRSLAYLEPSPWAPAQ